MAKKTNERYWRFKWADYPTGQTLGTYYGSSSGAWKQAREHRELIGGSSVEVQYKDSNGSWITDGATPEKGRSNPARKPPKGWIPASAVKITRNKGQVKVQIRKRR